MVHALTLQVGKQIGQHFWAKKRLRAMKTTKAISDPGCPGTKAKPKILVVDDDPAVRHILVRLLSEEGYLALAAGSGAEALALDESASFDLALLDLNMPLKDGWQTLEELATTHPLLPVILITARPNQFFPALAAGAGALLEKPLDFTVLFQTIRRLLGETDEARLMRVRGRASGFSYSPAMAQEQGHPVAR